MTTFDQNRYMSKHIKKHTHTHTHIYPVKPVPRTNMRLSSNFPLQKVLVYEAPDG